MSEPRLIPELYCTNIDDSLDFYIRILGFQILYDRPEEKFAMLERQGVQIMLEQLDHPGRRWLTGTMEAPFGRGVNFQIQTTNVTGLHDTVTKNNSRIFLPLEEKWYKTTQGETGNKQFIVQDPDGYLLRFFEDLGHR